MTHLKFSNRPADKSFDKLMDDFFGSYTAPEWKSKVPVNISETNESYLIDVFVPGVNKEDFQINLENNLLTIGLEKLNETKDENLKLIRNEYSPRTFKRSFTLDEKIDVEKIDAKYVNGVLTLNLPKKPEVKPAVKQISIQ